MKDRVEFRLLLLLTGKGVLGKAGESKNLAWTSWVCDNCEDGQHTVDISVKMYAS
jgi:hypothetical protein